MAKVTKGWGPKPSANLKNYMDARKGTILLGDIQAFMLKEHAKPSNRRQDIIHPSEMAKTGWCPRATYYRIKACKEANNPYLKPAESIGVQLLNIFDEGHMIHDKWQKRLRDMGVLWGNWKCISCGEHYHNQLPKEGCDYCGGVDTLIYTEVPLRSEQYLISGHADGAVPHLNALIEIKSVGAGTVRIEAPDIYSKYVDGQKIDLTGLWKAIEEPFPSHIRQGQLYLALCRLMGLSYDRIIFIYEAKFNQGVKEFVVPFDPDFCDDMLYQANLIKNVIERPDFKPNGENCPECKHKNLVYPFICECAEPIKCPTNGCKDCESYGIQKSSSTVGVEHTAGGIGREGTNSPTTPIKRTSTTTHRVIRSVRPPTDEALH